MDWVVLRESERPPALWRAALTGRVNLSIALNATRISRFFITGTTSKRRPLAPGYHLAKIHAEDLRGRPVKNNGNIRNQIVNLVKCNGDYAFSVSAPFDAPGSGGFKKGISNSASPIKSRVCISLISFCVSAGAVTRVNSVAMESASILATRIRFRPRNEPAWLIAPVISTWLISLSLRTTG